MNRRAFIKKTTFGIFGALFFTSLLKPDEKLNQKIPIPENKSNANSQAQNVNMALGHSLPHLDYMTNQKKII